MSVPSKLRTISYAQLVNMGVGLLGFLLALIQMGSDRVPWGYVLLLVSWGVNEYLLWCLEAVALDLQKK